MARILITGAAGNLGTLISRHLVAQPHHLRLLIHKKEIASKFASYPNVEICRGDLADPTSLRKICNNIDCILHLAGVLFRPHPEKFLHATNVLFVKNLVDAAIAEKVSRFILFSFPHVMGETDPEYRASEELNAEPNAVHARTRLEAEKYLLSAADNKMDAIVMRAGFIYGPGVKLVEACKKLLKWRLLAIWRKPTWVHLLSLPDFLDIVQVAIEKPHLHGIYNVCDDSPILLQHLLDELANYWDYPKPARLPEDAFKVTAVLVEKFAWFFHTKSPLSREILRMGMTSAVADTTRMKKELRAKLRYPSWREGIRLL